MITIIDYGLGNVLAIVNSYNRLNIPVVVANSSADLIKATKLILPGVGSFDRAMQLFDQSEMRQTIELLVFQKSMPLLGICVGMQMFANRSDEGMLPGLGWVEGNVQKFDLTEMPLPHMGWNDVKPNVDGGLFTGLEMDGRFYFLHSYYFECMHKHNTLAVTDYGGLFCCAVRRNNIYGVQFHPEKSHHFGSQLLRNFAAI